MIRSVNRFATLPLAMFLAALTLIPVTHAHESAIGRMAAIVQHLNHYPTDEEIRQLRSIDRNAASAEIHVLAGALIRMRHTVQPEDAAALKRLASNPEASADARELAAILLRVHHHPSTADRERLRALMNDGD